MSATSGDEMAFRPTVKLVALVADALRNRSRRGDILLDPFAGSSAALITALSVDRTAHLRTTWVVRRLTAAPDDN